MTVPRTRNTTQIRGITKQALTTAGGAAVGTRAPGAAAAADDAGELRRLRHGARAVLEGHALLPACRRWARACLGGGGAPQRPHGLVAAGLLPAALRLPAWRDRPHEPVMGRK